MFDLIVGGKWLPGASVAVVTNPYDGSPVGEVGQADQAAVDEALGLASKHQPDVARMTRAERASILVKVSQQLVAEKPDLAGLLAREVGKTIREARTEVDRAASTFATAAEEAKRIGGEVVPFDALAEGAGRRGFTVKAPLGTVVAITPFNFPLNLAAHKVAPAVASGNAVVLKPASRTPLAGLALGRILLEAGYPPGALSVLVGPGETVGMSLVRDSRPRMITFTGSAEVGRKIAGEAGLKRTAMELGSNSAVVVTRTADVALAAARIVQGGYALAGQVCISVQRVLADESIAGELTARVIDLASRLRVGDQLDEGTDVGPMISEQAAGRFKAWIEEAVQAGATLRLGGDRRGALASPTVLTDVPPDTRIWAEEAFGPVVCINTFRDFDQAIREVNRSRYGLQAGVFTGSLEETFRAIDRLEVGGVIVNDVPSYRVDHMPYGGVKDSGIGREGLKYAIEEMTETKLVCFNLHRT